MSAVSWPQVPAASAPSAKRAAKRAPARSMRAFAKDFPRARFVDGFAVGLHPVADVIEHRHFIGVNRAVRPSGNVEDERAVLADRIRHPLNRLARVHVVVPL